jgi:hypothetical protein
MNDTLKHPILPPEAMKKLADAAREREARAQAARVEDYRRGAAKAINDFAREHCQYLKDKYGVDLQPSKVFVALKKPKAYYDALVEAAALMKNDTYLLDRKVKDTIAEVFPEAARRAGYKETIPESAWYNEFSPSLQRRINRMLAEYGVTDECNSLAKVRDLIRTGGKSGIRNSGETGADLPTGRFHFNGDGTVHWFGSELTIQRKGAGGTQYVKSGGKLVNVIKTLESQGVTRDTIEQWAKNAEAAYKRRREHEEMHDENLRQYGSKYD